MPTEEKMRSKTLKKWKPLSPYTLPAGQKWCKKWENLWAHLCQPHCTPTWQQAPLLLQTFVGHLVFSFCFMLLVSSSWEGQDKCQDCHIPPRCWNFPTDYGPLCMDRLWFLCIDTAHNPSSRHTREFYLSFKCHKWSYLLSNAPWTLYTHSQSESPWHTLFRAFHHAGWYWLLWLSDSTCLIT